MSRDDEHSDESFAPLRQALEARLPAALPRVREALDDAEAAGDFSPTELRRMRVGFEAEETQAAIAAARELGRALGERPAEVLPEIRAFVDDTEARGLASPKAIARLRAQVEQAEASIGPG